MNNELTCSQVMALITFYLEDKLSPKLRQFVDNHLKSCPKCRYEYDSAVEMMSGNIINCDNYDDYDTPQYKAFKSNLSAYIDNELDSKESLRIKRIAISNPMARKDLQDMYTFKKMLKDSFDKTKTDMKIDYSHKIIDNLLQIDGVNSNMFPVKLVGAFTAIMCAAVAGFLILLYS